MAIGEQQPFITIETHRESPPDANPHQISIDLSTIQKPCRVGALRDTASPENFKLEHSYHHRKNKSGGGYRWASSQHQALRLTSRELVLKACKPKKREISPKNLTLGREIGSMTKEHLEFCLQLASRVPNQMIQIKDLA